jgi:AcrR family transcriptional regulator
MICPRVYIVAEVKHARPVLQARSQRTRDRLLDAAEALLAQGGSDAATVPAIARRARVAVGSVYRRFPDKDAVLRAVYERFFERSAAANRAALDPAHWAGRPLRDTVTALIAAMVRGYVQHRALLAALLRYAETHEDAAFRRRADALRGETFELVVAILLARRAGLDHPAPEQAIAFALLTVALVLKGLVLGTAWPAAGLRADHVERELTAMTLRYLGVN